MRITSALILGGTLASVAVAQDAAVPQSGTTELRAKIQRRTKWILPAEATTPVATGFHFADGIGADFKADIDGESLLIDADGDGELETRIEGEDGFVILQNGERRYGVSVTSKPQWSFTCGSAMVGEIGGTKVQVIDQNHNGSFNDIGEDALIVGRGRAASYLSETLAIGGQLLAIEVAADGSSMSWQPYEGEAGTLALSAVTEGKVLAAVLKTADGRHSVHLSKADTEVRLPAGDYLLDSGTLSLAGNRVQMRTGRSKPIHVASDARAELGWGGPAKAEFAYEASGAQLVFDPNRIWFYGTQGEEYFAWNPVGKSPRIAVTDKATGKQVAEAWFPGSC